MSWLLMWASSLYLSLLTDLRVIASTPPALPASIARADTRVSTSLPLRADLAALRAGDAFALGL